MSTAYPALCIIGLYHFGEWRSPQAKHPLCSLVNQLTPLRGGVMLYSPFFFSPRHRFLFTMTSVKIGPHWPPREAPNSVLAGPAASCTALLFSVRAGVRQMDGAAPLAWASFVSASTPD